MDKIIREVFELKDVDADSYSPLTLAYIGDCVYELTIRTLLVNKGNAPVNKLNKKASDLAKAPTQSKMISMLVENELLTGESLRYTKEAAMPSPFPQPRMPRLATTAGQPALKPSWAGSTSEERAAAPWRLLN